MYICKRNVKVKPRNKGLILIFLKNVQEGHGVNRHKAMDMTDVDQAFSTNKQNLALTS